MRYLTRTCHFEVLLDKIRPLAVQRRKSIVSILLFLSDSIFAARKIGDLTVSPIPTFSVGTPFELQLGFVERQEGIRAQWEYNPDLFDATTIRDSGILRNDSGRNAR